MAKRTVSAGTADPQPAARIPPPEEQAGEILLILDKEKTLLSALAKTDVDGKLKTVPATPEHNNDFLRLSGSDDWLESFAVNFMNQARDPTRFTLLKLSDKRLDDPLVKRAMADIERGKITKDVVKFLEKYEVKPNHSQSINPQKPNNMAKQENQEPAAVEQQQPPRYRFHEAMIDWAQVEAHGVTRDYLQQRGMLDPMMRGYKSGDLIPIVANVGGSDTRYQARVSFRQEDGGRVILQTHPLRQAPDFSRPFLGHNFSEDDRINLTQQLYGYCRRENDSAERMRTLRFHRGGLRAFLMRTPPGAGEKWDCPGDGRKGRRTVRLRTGDPPNGMGTDAATGLCYP